MNKPVISGWRGDIAGGVTAALVAIPVELAFGLFAVAPLGAAFAEHGVRAALWGCVLGGLAGFLLRGQGGIVTGTRSAPALILAVLAADLLGNPAVAAAADPAVQAFLLLLLCSALAGGWQLLFGLLRIGKIFKYVPYPVTAGLMLGVAFLLLLTGLRPALGVDGRLPWAEVPSVWRPASLAVAVATLAACRLAPRWIRFLPGGLVALLVGSLLHHGLAAVLGAGRLGGSAHGLTGWLPDYSLWQAAAGAFGLAELAGWLPKLAPYALAIAILASLETMLCLAAIGAEKSVRPDGDRELRTRGIATLVSGVLGATPSISNLARVRINLESGGRSTLSGLVYAVALAAIVGVAGALTSLLPDAVIAGLLAHYALGMVDADTRRLLRGALSGRSAVPRRQYRILLANAAVIVLVALVAVLGDMMLAIGIGVAAALFLFVRSNIRPVIRGVFDGRQRSSLKVRVGEDAALLTAHGERIVLIEIEGTLFFGTADRIGLEIDRLSTRAGFVILDLDRLVDVDPTGARVLLQAGRSLREQGKELLLAGADLQSERLLQAMGVDAAGAGVGWHADVDRALEAAEDRLLASLGGGGGFVEVPIERTELAAGLDREQAGILLRYLRVRTFGGAGTVFAAGAAGDSLYVASGSAVDILVPLQGGGRKRIACFAPGMFFGEMALLEGKPRSADAVVQGAGTLWELSRPALAEIERDHPQIACRILENLSRNLADRLRTTTAMLRASAEGALDQSASSSPS